MVGPPDAPVLAVLTRASSSGGKTRLFRSLGIPPARPLLDALLLDTLDASAVPGIRRLVVVTPAAACAEVATLVAGVEVVPQPEGDLGERMRQTMERLFAGGARAVALIGSDLPHLPRASVAAAFDLLARDARTLVLGPAEDGGYYLIAACRLPDVFEDVAWGTGRVLDQTERAALRDGFRVERLDPLRDVDTADDLRLAVEQGRASRTAAWVSAHEASGRGQPRRGAS